MRLRLMQMTLIFYSKLTLGTIILSYAQNYCKNNKKRGAFYIFYYIFVQQIYLVFYASHIK